MGWICNTHRRDEKYMQYLVGRPKEKLSLRRPRRNRYNSIEMEYVW
jgi:hypothetical protein